MAVNESRIEAARRRVRVARYSIGAAAAVAFALFGLAVRDAHPATQGGGSPAATTDVSSEDPFSDESSFSDDDSFGFEGGGSIGPSSSSSAPSVQSGGS